MAFRIAIVAAVAAALAAGCRSSDPGKSKGDSMTTAQKTITIHSQAFSNGQPIPRKFTGEGQNVSPPLKFDSIPDGTKQLVLIVDDPDAPREQPFVHWVLYNLAADTRELPEGVETTPQPRQLPGAAQGKNDARGVGYTGPMPPPGHGTHHYYFKLYALGTKLDLRPGMTKDAVMQAIKPDVIAAGELMGTYERK